MNASKWRSQGRLRNRKIGEAKSKKSQTVGKIGKDFDVFLQYTDNQKQEWRVKMKDKPQIKANVEVKDMPELHVAYIRHIGHYKGDSELFGRLFEKLMKWVGPRGLLRFPETSMLALYYDDMEITDEDKLRMDVCITVPEDTVVDGEIGKAMVHGGKYAVAHFELAADEYEDAWNAVFGGWLPESGYQPDDGPCYELYYNNPDEHPEGKHIVDICVPVKPL